MRATLSFEVDDTAPRTFDEMWTRGLVDLQELDAQEEPTEVDEHLKAEIDGIAGDCVPSNEALFAIFGEQIFHLLTNDVPSAEWQRYLEGGGAPPTGAYALYAIVKGMISERLVEQAEQLIEQRLQPEVQEPGPLSRHSALAEPAEAPGFGDAELEL